jgi:hydrogenase maturation protein HypF
MLPQLTTEVEGVLTARRLVLCGYVQGLGVRPAVARLAARLDLAGSVANRLEGVEIVVEGSAKQLDAFEAGLLTALPGGARLERIERRSQSATGQSGFRLVEELAAGPVRAHVPRDKSACDDCLREVAAKSDLRHRYPFTSCTRCGPRYSIIERMPYERVLTGMTHFSLCANCRGEYEDAGDRRFHAQTNCCPECGPHVWLVNRAKRVIGFRGDALDVAAAAIGRGQIVAVRGLGGYQLLCDATNDEVVRRLRKLKHRPAKPLAVMVESREAADRIGRAGPEERRALNSPENPIVLLPARAGSTLAREIQFGLTEVGVMLPTTPLHALLASATGRPLVVTSGNIEGAPLAVDASEAERELAGVTDLWLHHDRPIRRPIDDSVVRIIAGRAVTIRCARGLAPLPLALDAAVPVLALGGHQKGAVAVSNGLQCVLGPHVGDLDGVETQMRFVQHVKDFVELYGAPPELVVHDLHPTYFTTHRAHEQPVRRLAVQHHHAHVVAAMIEPGWLDREVLGVAFDGTGFGPDGTIWGGEFLLAGATRFQRAARLRPFRLPGGESAIREPWRIAVGLVGEVGGPQAALCHPWRGPSAPAVERVLNVRHRDQFSPVTSSVGRLFDGVAALVLGIEAVQYEGQAAMLLEAASDESASGEYEVQVREAEVLELDWRPLIHELLDDLASNIAPSTIAMRFHRGLAAATVAVARRFSPRPIVLGGGTFQNRLLTELIAAGLEGGNQPLGLPGQIPPNDGGLAAGQLAIALATLAAEGRN